MKELLKLFILLCAGHCNTGQAKEILIKKSYITYVRSYRVQFLNASTKKIRTNYMFAVNFEYSVTWSYEKVLAQLPICIEATKVASTF
jgi:hypothetical protein